MEEIDFCQQVARNKNLIDGVGPGGRRCFVESAFNRQGAPR